MPDGSKPISRRQRFEILRRDGHTCRYCGAQAPDEPLTVDHVIPVALGGGDDPTNLVTACRDCNSGKGSTSPDEHIVADVDAAALLFARAIDKVNAQRRADLVDLGALVSAFEQAWNRWRINGEHVALPSGWKSSVERFLEAGLTLPELEHYIRVAMDGPAVTSAVFQYMCGCCWRELGDRQEMARRLIEDGQV